MKYGNLRYGAVLSENCDGKLGRIASEKSCAPLMSEYCERTGVLRIGANNIYWHVHNNA